MNQNTNPSLVVKFFFNTKKEFELNSIKILYPPMIIHIDRNGENIIQPIPLCEKTNRHIRVLIKDINKKGGAVYKEKDLLICGLMIPKLENMKNMFLSQNP